MLRIQCAIACLAMLTLSAGAQVTGSPADEGANDLARAGTPPRLLHADAASYPDDPSLARTRHTCVISVVIGKDGKLRSAQLENTQPSPFDRAALEAVQRAEFAPATLIRRSGGSAHASVGSISRRWSAGESHHGSGTHVQTSQSQVRSHRRVHGRSQETRHSGRGLAVICGDGERRGDRYPDPETPGRRA